MLMLCVMDVRSTSCSKKTCKHQLFRWTLSIFSDAFTLWGSRHFKCFPFSCSSTTLLFCFRADSLNITQKPHPWLAAPHHDNMKCSQLHPLQLDPLQWFLSRQVNWKGYCIEQQDLSRPLLHHRDGKRRELCRICEQALCHCKLEPMRMQPRVYSGTVFDEDFGTLETIITRPCACCRDVGEASRPGNLVEREASFEWLPLWCRAKLQSIWEFKQQSNSTQGHFGPMSTKILQFYVFDSLEKATTMRVHLFGQTLDHSCISNSWWSWSRPRHTVGTMALVNDDWKLCTSASWRS